MMTLSGYFGEIAKFVHYEQTLTKMELKILSGILFLVSWDIRIVVPVHMREQAW